MLPEYFEFSLPTKVVYGRGIIERVGESVAPFGNRRALLVTDTVLTDSGLVERVRSAFADSAIDIVCTYDQVPPNSTIATVEACAALGREHECDLLVGLGGGSVMDTAKVANLLLVKGGQVADHMGAYLLGQERLLPLILIPTTAGTGSEVTKVAVIADPEGDVKLPFAETQFLPDLAILDPEVTVTMPPRLTAATGMDALTHAIEAYVDKEWSPATDALALHVITMVSENILRACARPQDLEARGNMLIASCLAGIAFSHSMVGMVHGISHALGGVYHVPHGLANALLLAEVMDYNLEVRRERYADIAEALGIRFPRPAAAVGSLLDYWGARGPARLVRRLTWLDQGLRGLAAGAAVRRVRDLNRQLAALTGMPLNLADAGVNDNLARLDQVVATALEDGAMLYNPREPEAGAVAAILKRVYEARPQPLPVSQAELGESLEVVRKRELRHVFRDTDMLYDVLGGFYQRLKSGEVGGPLLRSGLCVQFVYRDPEAVITIDARGDEVRIHLGDDFAGKPEVTMILDADIAHQFWHGKVNLVSALTRRRIVAKGNVPKTIKLLPVLKPAFRLYPSYLREKGLDELVLE
jgi:alcohol dehydrogenase